MGKNYYLKLKHGVSSDYFISAGLHIGKSSVGWKFVFQAYDFPRITSFNQWITKLKDSTYEIIDEDNEKIDLNELLELIESNSKEKSQSENNKSERYYFQDEQGYEFCSVEFS